MPKTYRTIPMSTNHPLRPPGSSYIYEHRLVLWNKIGPGPHPCYHGCGRMIDWIPGAGARRGSLVVDHLDNSTQNNDPANLVPSCNPCNQGRKVRKSHVRDDEVFVTIPTGTRTRAVERTCLNCGKQFPAPRRADLQKFCSRSCSSLYTSRHRSPDSYSSTSRSIRDEELWVEHSGSRARAVRNICVWCSEGYLVVKSQAHKSRYCGKTCRLGALHTGNRKG